MVEEEVSIEGTEIEKGLIAYADMSSYNVYSWKDVTIDTTHINVSDVKTKRRLERDAKKCWDEFYTENETNFYKDRHYLHHEFEGIIQKDKKSVLLEIGCGGMFLNVSAMRIRTHTRTHTQLATPSFR